MSTAGDAMRCPSCQQDNTPGARFCGWCGLALTTPLPTRAFSPVSDAAGNPDRLGDPRRWPEPHSRDEQQWDRPYAPVSASIPETPGGYGLRAAAPVGARYNAPAVVDDRYAPPLPGWAYPPAPQVINNITVTAVAPVQTPRAPVVVVAAGYDGPPLVLRALWFLLIGLSLGAVWTVLAWLCVASIIGLPIGLWMLNRLPQVMTLKPTGTRTQVTVHNGVVVVGNGVPAQYPFALRALYFLLVGWWASGLWLLAAWALVAATLGLGLPLAFWMFNRTPAIVTLARG